MGFKKIGKIMYVNQIISWQWIFKCVFIWYDECQVKLPTD